jgi:3-isopropylmalate/(R)-2-methylmalate dehydratase small subunit
MFNCGILAIELPKEDIDALFALSGSVNIAVDLTACRMTATTSSGEQAVCSFTLNGFDKDLVGAGGWLAYADQRY